MRMYYNHLCSNSSLRRLYNDCESFLSTCLCASITQLPSKTQVNLRILVHNSELFAINVMPNMLNVGHYFHSYGGFINIGGKDV